MGLFGNIGDFVGSTFDEIGKHPWQAAGAALGVPGFDPAIGGTFNNRPGGALLSPTGNFTSSAWNDMYQSNPGATSGLNMFHGLNSVADVVAPMIAGGYASGALGGAGGSTSGGFGLPVGKELDISGSLGSAPTGLFSGLDPSASMGSSFGGSALGGGFTGQMAGMGPVSFSGATSGATMAPWMQQLAQQFMQQGQGQGQQQHQPMGASVSPQLAFGNPTMHGGLAALGPSMPYSTFGGSGGQVTPLAQMLAMRGGM